MQKTGHITSALTNQQFITGINTPGNKRFTLAAALALVIAL